MLKTIRFFSLLFVCLILIGCVSDQESSQTNGTLIVLNKSEASASLISIASGEAVTTLQTGNGPHEVAVSPDGQTAVVTNYGARDEPGSSLTVIDFKNQNVITTIELGKYQRPHGLVFLPDGERILVTAEAQKTLLLVNLADGKVLNAIDTGQDVSHMVAYVEKVNKAFLANIGSGSVTVVDLQKHEIAKTIKTGAGAEGIDCSPDGKEIWVSNRADDSISIIDTKSLEIV